MRMAIADLFKSRAFAFLYDEGHASFNFSVYLRHSLFSENACHRKVVTTRSAEGIAVDVLGSFAGVWFKNFQRQLFFSAFMLIVAASGATAQFLDDGFGGIDLEFPPSAIAGDDIAVSVDETARLDGSASHDDLDSGTIEAYDWSLGSIVANNDRRAFVPEIRAYYRSLSIVDEDTVTPSLIFPTLPAGVFEVDVIVNLVVTDGVGNQSRTLAGSRVVVTARAEVPNTPSNIATTENAGNINVTFDIANNGGTPVTDIQYRLNGLAWQSTGSAAYAFTLSELDAMSSHTLEIRAENAAGIGAASSAKTVTLQNPRTAFEVVQSAYRVNLRDHAVRVLQGEQVAARRVVQSARDRLAASLSNPRAVNNAISLSTRCVAEDAGNCGQIRNSWFASGETFASLSVNGATTGSGAQTATFSLAREFAPSPETRWGVMLRAAHSDEDAVGVFTGNITTRAFSVGLYGATTLGEGLYLDGFMMLGRSRQSVALRTDAISIASNYWASNSLAGISLSGSHSAGQFTLLPALSGTVARGQIGSIISDVSGFDLLAGDIPTDLGSIWYSEVAFSPEIRSNLSTNRAGYVAFIPQWSCTDSNTAALRDECYASAEIKLQLENVTSDQTLMFSIMRDDLRRQGTSRIAAEFSVRF